MSHLVRQLKTRVVLDLSRRLPHQRNSNFSSCWEKQNETSASLYHQRFWRVAREKKVNMCSAFTNSWHSRCLTARSKKKHEPMCLQGSLGKEAFGFALVPGNDRLAGCVLHGSRPAINLSVPASLEIPALRLRRGRGGRRLNSQKCGFLNTSINSQCCAGFCVSLFGDFWCRVQRWSAIYSSSSTYVDGNQPT